MAIKQVVAITFNRVHDPELIGKLNAVAPFEYRNVHDLSRFILLQFLNQAIEQHGIDIHAAMARSAVGRDN